jgi:hypothetical protein
VKCGEIESVYTGEFPAGGEEQEDRNSLTVPGKEVLFTALAQYLSHKFFRSNQTRDLFKEGGEESLAS